MTGDEHTRLDRAEWLRQALQKQTAKVRRLEAAILKHEKVICLELNAWRRPHDYVLWAEVKDAVCN